VAELLSQDILSSKKHLKKVLELVRRQTFLHPRLHSSLRILLDHLLLSVAASKDPK